MIPLYSGLRDAIINAIYDNSSLNKRSITSLPGLYGTIYSILPSLQDNLDDLFKKTKIHFEYIEPLNLRLLFIYLDKDINIDGKSVYLIRGESFNQILIYINSDILSISIEDQIKFILSIMDCIKSNYIRNPLEVSIYELYATILMPYSILTYNLNNPIVKSKEDYIQKLSCPNIYADEILDLLSTYNICDLLDNYYIMQFHKEHYLKKKKE